MPLSNLDFLKHILNEAVFCLKATADLEYEKFIQDGILSRAVIRSLEIIGEASKKIHPDFKAKYPLVAWKEMAGMRDRLIHHYFGIDYEIVWATLKKDIPAIKEWAEIIITNEEPA